MRVRNVLGFFGNRSRLSRVQAPGSRPRRLGGGLDGSLVGAERDHDGLGGGQGHQAQQEDLEVERVSCVVAGSGWQEDGETFSYVRKLIVAVQQEIVDIH